MTRFVVERRFDPPLTEDELNQAGERMTRCMEIHGVVWLRTVTSRDGRRMICEYEAADAETVRRVQREARLAFDVVWTADLLEGE